MHVNVGPQDQWFEVEHATLLYKITTPKQISYMDYSKSHLLDPNLFHLEFRQMKGD